MKRIPKEEITSLHLQSEYDSNATVTERDEIKNDVQNVKES